MSLRDRSAQAAVGVVALVLPCLLAFGVSPGNSATKAPIKVGLVGDVRAPTQTFREAVTGAEARVKAINAAGGINGHRIALTKCDAKSDPNVGAACAQKMVDGKVVAVLNPFSIASQSMQPVWSNAKIPALSNPLLPIQYTDRYSYPISLGLVGSWTAIGQYLGEKGCRKAGIIASPIAAYQNGAANSRRAFVVKGGTIVSNQSPPPGAPDYTPYLQAVLNAGATCLIMVIPSTDAVKLLTAIKQSSRPNLLVATSPATWTGVKLGSLGNGMVGGQTYTEKAKFARIFASDYNRFSKGTTDNLYYREGWASARVLEQALRAIKGQVTSASVVRSLDTLRSIDPGISAPFSYRDLPFKNPAYARLPIFKAYMVELRNDKDALRKEISLRSTLLQFV